MQRSERHVATFHLPEWITTEAKLWSRAGQARAAPFTATIQQCLLVQIKSKDTRAELCSISVVKRVPSPSFFFFKPCVSFSFNDNLNKQQCPMKYTECSVGFLSYCIVLTDETRTYTLFMYLSILCLKITLQKNHRS